MSTKSITEAPTVAINLRATEDPVGNPPHGIGFTTKKARTSSRNRLPLLPTISDEAAHLIQAGRIPSLGDSLRSH
jgi:hypothetical protein